MPRYIQDSSCETLYVDGSLESLLPANSVARVIWGALQRLDFSAFDAAYGNDAMGRLALDPRRLAGVWMLGLLRGVTSSVKLAQCCSLDVEFRWMLGGAAVEKSTLSDFRKGHLEALLDLSTKILAALAHGGLLSGSELLVDGTIIQSAASSRANVSREALKERVARLRNRIEKQLLADDREEDATCKDTRRLERFEAALCEMDTLGLKKDKDRLTLTEPDVSLKKLKHGGFGPAHNVQAVTDAQSGAIIHLDVVDQGNDQGLLQPMVRAAQDELARVAPSTPSPVARVAADGAYHHTLQLKALEAQNIEAVVPDTPSRAPGIDAAFQANAFVYDEQTDTLQCPMGQTLCRAGFNEGHTAAKYRADVNVCNACPSKPLCCPNAEKQGRSVNRPLYPEVIEAVAQRVASAEGQRLLRARRATAEGAFARLIEQLHWRRCRTWTTNGARAEGLWRQITHNLMLLTGIWDPLVLKTT
jgi:transposase